MRCLIRVLTRLLLQEARKLFFADQRIFERALRGLLGRAFKGLVERSGVRLCSAIGRRVEVQYLDHPLCQVRPRNTRGRSKPRTFERSFR